MIDINELREAIQTFGSQAINEGDLNELLDRLELAEKEVAHIKEVEFPRKALAVTVGWKTKCARLEQERDALQAKIKAMEKQEPVATVRINAINGNPSVDFVPGHRYLHHNDKLYLAPGAQAQPTPSIPEGWLRAIDEALVVAHIGVANESDTFEQAREKLDNLIGFHVDVASDPAVNGGWKLVPIEPMPSMPKLHVGYLPTINQDGYPALGAWWVQLWDGDDVFARVYGSSPEEAHNRALMLAAAPEAKP